MYHKKDSLQLTNEFVVNKKDINDNGILTTCKILSEITSHSDQAIILAFGDLGIYRWLTSSYNINFVDQARKGDRVKVETSINFIYGQTLELKIVVCRKGKKDKKLALGHFIFRNAQAA
jgi:hypothetical protein